MEDVMDKELMLNARRRRQRGMSLVEVLIAVAIMMVIAMGLIPLFTRSIRQNREGANYTDLTNVARTTLEEYVRYDFNSPAMTVAPGSTSLVTQQYYDVAKSKWLAYPPAVLPANAMFQRTVTIEQFTGGDLTADGELNYPQDGGVTRDDIQIKRVRVVVRPLWKLEAALGRPTPVQLELLKAL